MLDKHVSISSLATAGYVDKSSPSIFIGRSVQMLKEEEKEEEETLSVLIETSNSAHLLTFVLQKRRIIFLHFSSFTSCPQC